MDEKIFFLFYYLLYMFSMLYTGKSLFHQNSGTFLIRGKNQVKFLVLPRVGNGSTS